MIGHQRQHIERAMKIRIVSERQWKIILCAALLFFGTMWALAAANWQQLLVPGIAGEMSFSAGGTFGRAARIKSVEPGSPLAALGVKPGDTMTYDSIGDAWRIVFAAGDALGMTIGDGSARRHVTVKAMATPHIDRTTITAYVIILVNSLVALVLAGLIGLRRASSPSARLLALILLMETSFTRQFMPESALTTFGILVLEPLAFVITYAGFFLFSCRFPNDESRHVPAWMRWAAPPVMLLVGAGSILSAANIAGWIRMPALFISLQPIIIALALLLSSINLWRAFRHTSGPARQRVQWVGMALGIRFLTYLLTTVPGLALLRAETFTVAIVILTTLTNIGLAYGILRHRLFDVGFAVNRALVYTIVSVVLLVAFGLMEWLAHHFVSPEEAEKNAFLDAAIALGLYLVFHRLRHSVDHVVDRLFFHKWHANEERLRRFVGHAAHITSPQVLIDAFLAALQRFTGEAGCAVYRQGAHGYQLTAAAGLQAPQTAGIDEPLAVALRAESASVVPADCVSALPGVLALPMRFRGELQGFVLLGQKPSQDAYRPDEIAVLEHAAHQVGLDLQALRTEQLQLEVAGLRQELALKNAVTRVV
jgi:hypothetical protein